MIKPISNNKGITLTSTIVGMAIGSIVLVAIASFVSISVKRSSELNRRTLFFNNSLEISNVLNKDRFWNASLNHPSNTSFNCLLTTGVCPKGGAFSIYDQNGNVFFNGATQNMGYDSSGASCDTYPSTSCPTKFTLSWEPLCTANCSSHIAILISGTYDNIDPLNKSSLKSQNFSVIKMVKNPNPVSNLNVNTVKFGAVTVMSVEGSIFSYDLVLDKPTSKPVKVTICRTAVYGILQIDLQKMGGDCLDYTIPANITTHKISEKILDDQRALNQNKGYNRIAYAIIKADEVGIGTQSVFFLNFVDNDNYLEILSLKDTGPDWVLEYRQNNDSVARLYLADGKMLYSSNCFGGNTTYPQASAFSPSPGNTFTISKTCLLKVRNGYNTPLEDFTMTSGTKLVLRAGNAEGANTSNEVTVP